MTPRKEAFGEAPRATVKLRYQGDIEMGKKNRAVLSANEKTALMKRLLREALVPRKKLFAIAVLAMLVGSASTAMVAWLTRSVVNSVFVSGGGVEIVAVAGSIALIFFMRGMSDYVASVSLGKIRAGITSEYLMKQFNKIIRSKMSLLRAKSGARTATKVNRQAGAAANAVMLVSTNLIKNTLTVVFLTAVMVYQQPILSLAAVIVAPIALIFLLRLNSRIGELAKQETAIEGGVIASLAEAMDGAAVVKSFQIEDRAGETVKAAADKREDRINTINRIMSANSPIMETFGGLVIVLVLLYASTQSLSTDQTPGGLVSFIIAFMLAYAPAKKLSSFNLQLTRVSRKVSRMYGELDSADSGEEEMLEKPEGENAGTSAPVVLTGENSSGSLIEFKDVTFSYVSGSPALRNVSFTINPGERVAIVGPSGAGKTSIVNLLLGFEHHSSGTIEINHLPISQIPVAELRRNITLVSQETFLFEDTLRNNIAVGNKDASPEQIAEVIERARISDFLKEMPDGLDTEIGSLGGKLSGGQRQRVSIARAMLKPAPIVIWDEATSALDGNTEMEINQSASKVFAGRTQLFISHRINTAENSEKVIFLENGRVKAVSTHKKLLKESADYNNLWGLGDKPNGF